MATVSPTEEDIVDIPPVPQADLAEEPSPKSELDLPLGPGMFPGIRRPFRSMWWLFRVVLGIGFLLPLLAGLAALPVLNVISLGMLLDAEARVARSGRFRHGFPLLPMSTRVGTIGLITLIFLIPIMMLSSLANSQAIIKEISGLPPGQLRLVTIIVQVAVFTHVSLAIANGGSFACFVRPLRNVRRLISSCKSGEFSEQANLWSERILALLKPWQHFTLAIKAAAGALCWLLVPTLLLGVLSSRPHQEQLGAASASFIGGVLLIPVAAWLPLLQCHQASTGRFMAIFEVGVVREIINRVPVRWAVSTLLLYALAVPLYLSKIVVPPADAFWLFTPLFVIVIYPTRLLVGWVYGAGTQKTERCTPLIRWPAKVFMIPMLGLYSLILFAIPLISEAGPRAMFENHAFLLPAPR